VALKADGAADRAADGIGVLVAGVLYGQLLLFATGEVLALPAAVGGAVALDCWLILRARRRRLRV